MKAYNNNSYPIKIKYRNKDSETINVYNFRSVFYSDVVNVSSVTVDDTSSVIFMTPQIVELPNTIIESGQMLLTDKDCIIKDELVIKPGGELRII